MMILLFEYYVWQLFFSIHKKEKNFKLKIIKFFYAKMVYQKFRNKIESPTCFNLVVMEKYFQTKADCGCNQVRQLEAY